MTESTSQINENVKKLIFLRLDRPLRMLLTSIQDVRTCTNEERMLALLRTQVTLLKSLQHIIQELAQQYGFSAIMPMMDYIFMPLRILVSLSCTSADNSIRQSAIWKSSETAAQVMESLFKVIGSLSPKQTVDCLVSCSSGLPMEANNNAGSSSLDRGDDCKCAILVCMDTILKSVGDQKKHEEALALAMDGALVGRIAHGCITLVSMTVDPLVKLQALQVLDSLMVAIPRKELWRSLFPGCFAGLCTFLLSQLRLAPAQASPKAAAQACRTLSHLLCLTLATDVDSLPSDAIRRLQALSIQEDSEKDSNDFLHQVHERLPAPLILLFNLIPTSTSKPLRQAAATHLCHAILVETGPIWKHENATNVTRSAMECCIVLSQDMDETIASSCRSSIKDYNSACGVENMVGPRIVELLQELPVLAQSGRETELLAKINLVTGYLELNSDALLRSSLLAAEKEIRTALAALLDVDFDSIQYSPRIAEHFSKEPECRFRFLKVDTAKAAQRMVYSFGKTLGLKGASFIVDACVADVLGASATVTHNLTGTIQVDWVHQWIGMIWICRDILLGAFEKVDGEASRGDSATKACHKNSKRLRKLKSLARAILPALVSEALWSLPTVANDFTKETELGGESTSYAIENGSPRTSMDQTVMHNNVSASALKGNSALVCSLIGLVSTIVNLLSMEVDVFLPTLLYPLCEKTSSRNHSQVQRAAIFGLHQVAMACELSSTRQLMRQNFDYLFGSMLSKTRVPGGGVHSSFPMDIPGIATVVLKNAISEEGSEDDAFRDEPQLERFELDKTCIPFVIELVTSLVACFDQSLASLNRDPLLLSAASLELVKVFDAAVSFIASSFRVDVRKRQQTRAEMTGASEPWLALLEPFRISMEDEELDVSSAKEGFEKIRKEREDQAKEHVSKPSIDITTSELSFLKLVLERCSFFVSSSSLHVQVASCTCMRHSYILLGFIAKHTTENESDDGNGPRTAITREIANSWPAIIARLRSLISTVCSSANQIKTVSIRTLHAKEAPSASLDVTSHMAFLSSILELVATMAEVSGDFMVRRVGDQVWPAMARLLEMYVREEKSVSRIGGGTIRSNDPIRHVPLPTERERLLFSLLEFLSRIYSHRECGCGLARLIPTVGTIVLPFLRVEGELRSQTMATLKAMLMVDCDALERSLLDLSHRLITRRLWPSQQSLVPVKRDTVCRTPIEQAAAELLDFIESLSEQPFPK